MSRTTLRIVIILAVISIAGITFTQIYWVRKAFDLRENQFYRDVNTSLNNVAQKIFEINKLATPTSNVITQVSTNYFVVLVNGPIDASVLEFLLITEFDKHKITDFDCINLTLGHATGPKILTQKEADVLKLLCINKDRLLKREEILKSVWGNDDYFLGRSLDVFISKLRKYLKEDSSVEIVNYHGVGFKLECK